MRKTAKKPQGLDLSEAEWAIMRAVWDHEPCAAGTVKVRRWRWCGGGAGALVWWNAD